MINEGCVVFSEDSATRELEFRCGAAAFPYIRLRRDTDAIYARRGGALDAGSLIQLAIDDGATRGEPAVMIPPGSYLAPVGLTLRNNTTLTGCGSGASRIMIPSPDVTAILADASTETNDIGRAGVSSLMIRYVYETASGSGRGVHLKAGNGRRVWKFSLKDVQIYGAGSDAVYSEGTASGSVVESDFRNIEAAKFKGHGIRENAYTYDQYLSNAFMDGIGASGFGLYVEGGSGVYSHAHCVGSGANNGAGVLGGGGFRITGHFNHFSGCHADRPAGNGFVVGGYGAQNPAESNTFIGCLSFNPGVPYENLASGVAAGLCWKIGKVRGLQIMGGLTGAIGSEYLRFNHRGFLFESSETNGVLVQGHSIRKLQGSAVLLQAAVPSGRIALNGCSLNGNTSTWSTADGMKMILSDNQIF